MRAVLSKAPGGPETLVVEEVSDPTPKKGEVIIKRTFVKFVKNDSGNLM